MGKLNSYQEWREKHPESYRRAVKLGIQKETAKLMGWEYKEPGKRINWELVIIAATKCKGYTDFRQNNSGMWQWIIKHNLKDKLFNEMKWQYSKNFYHDWKLIDFLNIAKQYSSLKEWQNKHSGSYHFCRINKLQHKIAKKLGWSIKKTHPKGFWDFDSILKEAKTYKNAKDWRKKGENSYSAARKLNIHRHIYKEIGWNVKKKNVYKTFDSMLTKAKEFSSYREWVKDNSYYSAVTKQWHHDIAKAMGWKITSNAKQILCHQNKKTYKSATDAAKDLGIKNINAPATVASGHRNSVFGYTFEWVE